MNLDMYPELYFTPSLFALPEANKNLFFSSSEVPVPSLDD